MHGNGEEGDNEKPELEHGDIGEGGMMQKSSKEPHRFYTPLQAALSLPSVHLFSVFPISSGSSPEPSLLPSSLYSRLCLQEWTYIRDVSRTRLLSAAALHGARHRAPPNPPSCNCPPVLNSPAIRLSTEKGTV